MDGILCDGGDVSGQGWVFFSLALGDVSGSGSINFGNAAKLQNVKVYNQLLLTSEVISNWRAGMQ